MFAPLNTIEHARILVNEYHEVTLVMKLLIINVIQAYNDLIIGCQSDTITHVTLTTINGGLLVPKLSPKP